jgi:hypothetical protein
MHSSDAESKKERVNGTVCELYSMYTSRKSMTGHIDVVVTHKNSIWNVLLLNLVWDTGYSDICAFPGFFNFPRKRP